MQETRFCSLGWEDPWRRKWQPTPVFLPGKSHRWRSLIGYSPWGHKVSDMTEWLHVHVRSRSISKFKRGTQKPLDESESGEWKSWLKAQHSENKDHGIRSHHFMGNTWGNSGNSVRLYFLGLQNHYRWWLQPWLKDAYSLEGKLWPT